MIAKQAAAKRAVESVEDGMVVGLGSGTTSEWAVRYLGERVKEGLRIQAVPTSAMTEQWANQWGIPLVPLTKSDQIDIAIDGADEVDPRGNLIKGGGGALLREKIVAYNSRKFIVIVDESKLVRRLGRFPLPVEVVPFALDTVYCHLEKLGGNPAIRSIQDEPYRTDNGNGIIDCSFGEIHEPVELDAQLRGIPGIVETGLFIGMSHTIIVGHEDGTTRVLALDT